MEFAGNCEYSPVVAPIAVELRPLTPADLPAARAVLAVSCAFDRAAEVAEEKLFARAPAHLRTTVCGAFGGDELIGVTAASGRWIRLLAVLPGHRQRGVGSALLAAAESAIAATGAQAARTMDQPGNYLAPGIDVRNRATLAWLGRRGYRPVGENLSLIIPLSDNPRLAPDRLAGLVERCQKAGYELDRAGSEEIASVTDAVGRAFAPAWAHEVERALLHPAGGVFVARRAGELVSFAVHDGNNSGLGWFGPAGTLPEHRGLGLGLALCVMCLADLQRTGHAQCIVSWIGPRPFYEAAAGVAGELRYAVLQKDLTST